VIVKIGARTRVLVNFKHKNICLSFASISAIRFFHFYLLYLKSLMHSTGIVEVKPRGAKFGAHSIQIIWPYN